MRWSFGQRKRREEDLDTEIAHDLMLDVRERVETGTSPEEAALASRKDFGNVLSAKEATRETWGWTWLEVLVQDLRYAVRMMRKSPGFTLVAVLSLALGIGVNAAMFSLADALLLRPLSVTRPGDVVTVTGKTPSDPAGKVSYRDYVDLREGSKSFTGLVAFKYETFGFAAEARDLPQMRMGMLVSGNFFQAMGVDPALGRSFRPEEDQVPGRDAVVVLGHDFWEKQLGANPSIVGRKVRLDGLDFTVIGVAPERFTGMDQYIRPALIVPLMMAPRLSASPERNLLERRDARALNLKGRLAAGTTRAQAEAELAAIARNLERSYPDTNRDQGVSVETELQARIQDDPVDSMLSSMLLGLAAVVLLVACANIANLMLSRARSRTREIAIRLAVGAGRLRLVRQLLAESVVIALVGGVVSLVLAYAGAAFLSRIPVPSDLPIVIDVRVDHRVLLLSLALSLVSAVLFGLAPALQAARTELVGVLKAEDADRLRKQRFMGRNALVVTQVALAMVLMVVATVLARGFQQELMGGPGFRTDHLLLMSFDPTLVLYGKPRAQQFYKQLVERARATPGVKSAALVNVISFGPNQHQESIVPEGYHFPKGIDRVDVFANWVDESFFDTMAVPLLRGRGFRASDLWGGPRVAVINEVMAQHYWPNQDPVGKRFRLGDRNGKWVQIVGVAKTGKYIWIGEAPTEFIYLALDELPSARMTLVAQSYSDAAGLVTPLREMVRGLDPGQPMFDVRTMQDFYQMRAIGAPGMIIVVVRAMGLIGLLLALVGLYGLMAYSVARRTREIGIRMAIGADRGLVVRMVLRQGLRLALAGLAIGLVASLGAEKAVMAIFGSTERDALAYVLVAPALLAVTMLAAWVPARRASRVDPIRTLRYE